MNYIYGINAVAEALKARGRSFEWVGVLKERHDLRLQRVVEECRRNGVAVRFLGRPELDRMAGNNAHQGVVAITSGKQYNHLDDIVAAKRGRYSLVVVLDGIEDPHNLGAILRTADASGADGVVIPERRAAGVTATVIKASAGASEHLPIAKVTNIARTLEELKDKNHDSALVNGGRISTQQWSAAASTNGLMPPIFSLVFHLRSKNGWRKCSRESKRMYIRTGKTLTIAVQLF